VARRRLTVRRLDPWSVLKFGAVANVALLIIGLLVVGVVFFIVDRLGLVDQVCSIVLDVGFTACGVNAGNLFRAIALLGLLGVVIQTAVLVFLSFLHNLIADLTGGLTLTVIDDTPAPGARAPHTATTAGAITTARRPPEPDPRSTGRPPVEPIDRQDEPHDEGTREHAPADADRAPSRPRQRARDRGSDDDLFRPI
jgi:hypothetical protein